jgi:hypothetical protein
LIYIYRLKSFIFFKKKKPKKNQKKKRKFLKKNRKKKCCYDSPPYKRLLYFIFHVHYVYCPEECVSNLYNSHLSFIFYIFLRKHNLSTPLMGASMFIRNFIQRVPIDRVHHPACKCSKNYFNLGTKHWTFYFF